MPRNRASASPKIMFQRLKLILWQIKQRSHSNFFDLKPTQSSKHINFCFTASITLLCHPHIYLQGSLKLVKTSQSSETGMKTEKVTHIWMQEFGFLQAKQRGQWVALHLSIKSYRILESQGIKSTIHLRKGLEVVIIFTTSHSVLQERRLTLQTDINSTCSTAKPFKFLHYLSLNTTQEMI